MLHTYLMWGGFIIFILGLLILDLKVLQKDDHEIKVREALAWTGFWIALALLFNAGVYYFEGTQKALEFLTAYLIEKSLSVDNIFVFLMVFSYFGIPPKYQHRVLFWGIIGALIMRAAFILVGVALIERIHWIIYVFGAFLIFIGIKMALEKEKEIHPEKNPVLKYFRKIMPVTKEFVGHDFFTKKGARWAATPLFVVLLVIESTDIVFAVDSIPAVLAISHDPFIVYTSNVFAILGLRALYFAIAGVMRLFHYLNYGLAFILIFVGIKMILADYYKLPVSAALGVIAGVLAISVIASIMFPKKGALPPHGMPDKR
ncbi:MAG TPA: TerC family protein [Spirochaetota bacterium]|nr:MAG: Inner membrane protein alx [Spirochaetes bacterium ADurb.BinA120]HPI15585.1 TerC family protein [Spirochaetota bacterium]HPO46118.1 TerC family protein [Spirochaetota bacterium]